MPVRTELDVRFDQAVLEVEGHALDVAKQRGLDEDTLYQEFVARLASRFAGSSADIAVKNRRNTIDRE